MATTLTESGEITKSVPDVFCSFPIEKTETTPDGDIMVYGKASDGSVDSDQQIVDPKWMAKAVREWLTSGPNLRVQHNPQRDPAGIGLTAETDSLGATWVKGLVIEPTARRLVSKGALRAYSVGIARPTIERDVTGKAKGGIITDGTLVEISLVDRPANKSCGIQLVKSASDGTPEFSGEVFGDDEVIRKALGVDLAKSVPGTQEFTLPEQHDVSFEFTPNDLAKIVQNKIIESHYGELALKALYDAEAEVYKRDIDTATRRRLAGEGHALPDGSYPIENTGDLQNAAHLARTGHGNAAGAKRLIAREAEARGVPNPLTESEKEEVSVTDAVTVPEVVKDGAIPEITAKEAEPEVIKDPQILDADGDRDGDGTVKAKKPKKGKKGKSMPPWLVTGDDGDGDGADKACKLDHAHSEKCMPSGTPKTAGKVTDAADMKEIPNTSHAPTTPMPAGRNTPDHKGMGMSPEAAAMMRFKFIGVDTDLGRLHDFTCPAYSPEDVSKAHPFSSFETLINEDVWMRKAVESATGPMEKAMEMTRVWESAQSLKNADFADLNDYRAGMHKAFRDANPGPTSYPSPCAVSPGKFQRPVITDGRAANSAGYDAPNSSAMAATGPSMGAGSYDRPPLTSGHQSPSPSFMKGTFAYPDETGVPMRLTYAHEEKEKARRAISTMHDHLAHMFPTMCPMIDQDPYRQPTSRDVPPTAGIGKSGENPGVTKDIGAGVPAVLDDPIEKGRKKMMKKLGKKVMAGKLTVDEARSMVGNRMSRKTEEMSVKARFDNGEITRDEALKVLGFEVPEIPKSVQGEVKTLEASSFPDPDIIKNAIAEAIAPLVAKIEQQEAVVKSHEDRWEMAANEADPKTAGFSGIALNMVNKAARPAGAAEQAGIAERTQQMLHKSMKDQLTRIYRTTVDPYEREAAWNELTEKYGAPE